MIRFVGVASSVMVGLLVVLAGASLMLASSLREVHGDIWPYPIAQTVGLGSIAVTWMIYMASMILLLGYEDAAWRRGIVGILFLGCCGFLVFVVWNIGLPFHFTGTQSIN